jgi:hypothetical protein
MSQMGLLSLENRHRMIPLRISEKLVSDLEKLDQLHEYVNEFTQIKIILFLEFNVKHYFFIIDGIVLVLLCIMFDQEQKNTIIL